ncbi:hypothetical protein NC99_31330 [Sunxiuqinia dokdonensis]|uniref:ATP synthase I n=2 Tax=Sunxiuqinia dokdonensis TaxID=1409788 RepID=A0A0L8V6Q8_9BACT|nr:hypothetical protein NC99_31330 [Sunxiuqinia dokdonensis]
MNALMKRFILRSVLLTLSLAFTAWILYNQIIPQHHFKLWPFILIFFFATTNLVHFYLLRIAGSNMPKFTSSYMVLSTGKMLFYLLVAIVFFMAERELAKLFLVNYLIAYVCFTILEVAEISRVVKLNN